MKRTDRIKIEAVNVVTEETRHLATVLTDSPSRAIQAYEEELHEDECLMWDWESRPD